MATENQQKEKDIDMENAPSEDDNPIMSEKHNFSLIISIFLIIVVGPLVVFLVIYGLIQHGFMETEFVPYYDGHGCRTDNTCRSTYCQSGICTHVENDQVCFNNIMCYSQICNDKHECVGVSVGDACLFDEACFSHLCVNGTCQALEFGDQCDHNHACHTDVCNSTNQCDTLSMNHQCTIDANCHCNNCITNRCVFSDIGSVCSDIHCCANCQDGTCRTTFKAACNADTDCPNYHCIDNKCTGRYPGQSCNSTQECARNVCSFGTCIGYHYGTRCFFDEDCYSMSCNGICQKASQGQMCNQNVDCISENCSGGVCFDIDTV